MSTAATSFESDQNPTLILDPMDPNEAIHHEFHAQEQVSTEDGDFESLQDTPKNNSNLKKGLVVIAAVLALAGAGVGGWLYFQDQQVKKAVAAKIAQEQAQARIVEANKHEAERVREDELAKEAAAKQAAIKKAEIEELAAKQAEEAASLVNKTKAKTKKPGAEAEKSAGFSQTLSAQAPTSPVAAKPARTPAPARTVAKPWFTVQPD